MLRKLFLLAVAALLIVPAWQAQAQGVTGRASVVWGDVLSLNGRLFKLNGIDAVEFHQFCYVDGVPWACGAPAVRQLQTLVDIQATRCVPTGESAGAFGEFAVCDVGGLDLARDLVEMGLAIADRDQSMDYVAAEEAARAGGVGIWAGRFANPEEFVALVTAVEDRIRDRALPTLAAAFEERLVSGVAVPGFSGVAATTATVDGEQAVFRATTLAPGFILDAVPPPQIFNWDAPAADLQRWRNYVRILLDNAAADAIWDELHALPTDVVRVADAATFLEAVEAAAAPLVAAGRQPVLLVYSGNEPPFIADWIGGNAPAGVTVARRPEVTGRNYLTTINGIDVFTEGTPPGEAYVLPADILVGVTYGIDADARVVTVADAVSARGEREAAFRYVQDLEWLPDRVTLIRYPYAATPYEGQLGNEP